MQGEVRPMEGAARVGSQAWCAQAEPPLVLATYFLSLGFYLVALIRAEGLSSTGLQSPGRPERRKVAEQERRRRNRVN